MWSDWYEGVEIEEDDCDCDVEFVVVWCWFVAYVLCIGTADCDLVVGVIE